MKLSGVFAWARQWLRWMALPPPLWVAGSLAATVCAIWLCIGLSPWAPAVAVLYQVGGAVLAVWQFVSLQQGLNPGWLTREAREWWAQRPRKLPPITASANITLEGITAQGYASATNPAEGTIEEQLLNVQRKLGAMESTLLRLEDGMKVQRQQIAEQLEAAHRTALAFSKAAEQRLSQSITSAPLQTALGLWLILLGSGMQVWLALP